MTKRALLALLEAVNDDVDLCCWDERSGCWRSAFAMIERSARTGRTTIYLRPETDIEKRLRLSEQALVVE